MARRPSSLAPFTSFSQSLFQFVCAGDFDAKTERRTKLQRTATTFTFSPCTLIDEAQLLGFPERELQDLPGNFAHGSLMLAGPTILLSPGSDCPRDGE